MVEALLEHVRPAGSVGDTLVRIREHLATAIEYAREDGEMPTDEADLARIGRLVEDLTEIILSSAVTDEHFVFGAYGAFSGILATPTRLVHFRMNSGTDDLDLAVEEKPHRTESLALTEAYRGGLRTIESAVVR